ncbi:hypothetical protein H5404_18040 [Vibrio parahaemolyticus]|uniref:hypothetical protein n=1 Tax=Vibrio parahaemolyticus TaxID=670 RepID=UPI001627E939|nr:hypothetical protein [Vibrio parahaemolyticus]QNE57723.1 hypothetical protein H5404_18040 [Vibrio parahaemolyticus]
MSVIKLVKAPMTLDTIYPKGVKGAADFANHLLYNVVDPKTGLYSDKRCKLMMKLNPMFVDFGEYLKLYGSTLTKKEIKRACFKEVSRQKKFWVEPILNSPKRHYLDENFECFDTSKLFNLKGNFSVVSHETQRILDAFGNDEEKKNEMMFEMTEEFLCLWINQYFSDRGLSMRVTREELPIMINLHLDTKNEHVHFYMPCYVKGRMINPRYFSLSKQKAHTKLEKKYKQFLDQGISLGFDKIEGLEQRRNYLIEQFEQGCTMREAIDNYRALQQRVKDVYKQGMGDPKQLQELLKANGIEEVKVNKKAVNLRFSETTAIFNIESFRDKEVRDLLHAHSERVVNDRTSNIKVHELEKVIQYNYDAVQAKLQKKLYESPAELHHQIKRKAFKLYAKRLKKSGIIIDLTKQGAASYIVQGINSFKSDKNVSLTPFKSSLMVNPALRGKSLLSEFELTQDDIFNHGIEYMDGVPKSIRYGKKRAYATMDLEESNLVSFESYRLKFNENYLLKLGAEKFELENGFVLFKQNKPLLKVERYDNGSAILTTSNVHPREAANLMLNVLIEDAKNLDKDKYIRVTPLDDSKDVQRLRELHLKLMFSNDKNARNIVVDYPDMANDPKLEEMIQKQLEYQFTQYDKSFASSKSKIKKGVYNFTDAKGVGLLNNPKMKQHKHLVEEKLNTQIIELITKHDVTEIKFNQRVDVEYFKDNQHKLIEMSQHLSREEQDKVKKFLSEFEEAQSSPTQKNENEQKQKNRIKRKA